MNKAKTMSNAALTAVVFVVALMVALIATVSSLSFAYADDAVSNDASTSNDATVSNDAASNDATVSNDAASSNGGSKRYFNNYSNYPVYEGTTTDEYGFHILTEEALGCQLKMGWSYRVTSNVTLCPSSSDYIAGLVANNNLIYVDAGCTLSIQGSSGWSNYPGLPGIALTSGKNLFFAGEGKVTVRGGNAGNGQDGYDGNPAWKKTENVDTPQLVSGPGGQGGWGGGGAGAGIGTAGGYGGLAGSVPSGVWSDFKRYANDSNGNDAEFNAVQNAGVIDNPGVLCIAGNVTVDAVGGNSSSYSAHGGRASARFYDTSGLFTKHLSGESGGGGGGAGGSSANGYGKGGEGGGAGGAGGSAGSMWRTRGTSDDPPSADGGGGGVALSGSDASSGGRGQGNVRTVGSSDCHGGKGAAGGRVPSGSEYSSDSKGFSVLGYGAAASKAFLPTANRSASNTVPEVSIGYTVQGALSDRTGFSAKASMETLSSYTGYAKVKDNGGWYVKNELLNADGQQTASWEYFTIASVTTVKEVEDALASRIPTKQGLTFKGWAFADDKTNLVFDAQTKKLNTQLLVDKKKVIMSSSTEGVWWSTSATPLIAVWEKDTSATFSIVYHTNGGTFVTTTGEAVKETQYVDKGQPLSGSVTLWDNSSIGAYRLNPPASMASTSKLLGWTKKVTDEGYPDGSIYKPGTSLDALTLNPYSKSEIHLYAVWKQEKDSNDTSSTGSTANSSAGSTTDSSAKSSADSSGKSLTDSSNNASSTSPPDTSPSTSSK